MSPSAIPLSLATLDQLPPGLMRPRYRRDQLTPGIVHFGVGNFHRAHQALYLDELMNAGEALDWAIIGAGVLPSDAAMREKLAGQDYLTTLVEQEADYSRARIIGPMIDFIAPGESAALLGWLENPAIRIVSLTITEGGYFIAPSTGMFDPEHPAIRRDGASPADPKTVFGYVVAALARRRIKGLAPFTVMSCDNIPHNGHVTRKSVVGLARLSDATLADWIERNVAFPNGMVDRITPATADRERNWVREKCGIADEWPVFCEGFKQWVIEDHFPAGRPAFEKAGAQFVPDVSPYEAMKIRILNGGHAVIAYPGGLMGIHYVHEAMENPLIAAFLEKVEREEIIPHVPPVPDTSLPDYFALIARRFANPKIGDTIRRLCLDGSNRQPKFIIPVIADCLAAGTSVDGLALESALWCRYCLGKTDAGDVIEPNDPQWSTLTRIAAEARSRPGAWLAMADIYGETGKDARFAKAFSEWLSRLASDGTEQTLRRYLSMPSSAGTASARAPALLAGSGSSRN